MSAKSQSEQTSNVSNLVGDKQGLNLALGTVGVLGGSTQAAFADERARAQALETALRLALGPYSGPRPDATAALIEDARKILEFLKGA